VDIGFLDEKAKPEMKRKPILHSPKIRRLGLVS